MWKPSLWTALMFFFLFAGTASISLSPLFIFTWSASFLLCATDFLFLNTDEKRLKKRNRPPLGFSKLTHSSMCCWNQLIQLIHRYLILTSFYWITLNTMTTFTKVLVVWWYEDQKIETVYIRDNKAILQVSQHTEIIDECVFLLVQWPLIVPLAKREVCL